MLLMQTFQVPLAFSNGLSRLRKWDKRKAILPFSCSPLDHPKGDGKFLFGEIPAQPPAGGKAVSLLSCLPALTGQKTHREEGNLRKKLTGKVFTLHCKISGPFPVKSYIGKNGNETFSNTSAALLRSVCNFQAAAREGQKSWRLLVARDPLRLCHAQEAVSRCQAAEAQHMALGSASLWGQG